MKKLYCLIVMMFLIVSSIYSQQNFCADSSYRIKYIFSDKGAQFYNVPDTNGINFFVGAYSTTNDNTPNVVKGAAIMKTNWGDSVYWAKKFYLNNAEILFDFSLAAPNDTKICVGGWIMNNRSLLLISKIDGNGNVLWAKLIKPIQGFNLSTGTYQKNILVVNNAIYLTLGISGDNSSTIVKLDLNGNILWSKSFTASLPNNTGVSLSPPIYYNNSIYFLLGYNKYLPSGNFDYQQVIARLSDVDGSFIEAFSIKSAPDPLIQSIAISFINHNSNNSFSLTGDAYINNTASFTFNIRLDSVFNQLSAIAYKTNLLAFGNSSSQYDFNRQSQHAILSYDIYSNNNKYFVTFGSNDEVLRSRKFVISGNFFGLYMNSVNFDDKQNLHYLYHHSVTTPQSPIVTEYARISNLAPNGTLGCFGKDTSIFTPYAFNIIKEPFVWNNIVSNTVTTSDVTFIEEDATVTKEVVCKIVSLCNNVKINGPASACIGAPVRYTISKNSGCFKNSEWVIDTSFANIINTEGDSAITIQFKKPYAGYIHAALTDCVVKDSFFVKAVTPLPRPLINRTDSLLCPGKTLTLIANNGFSNYLWQGSTAGQQLVVNAAGLYKITALDSCNNLKTDSINIALSDTSLNIIPTQTVCLFDTAFIVLPADVVNITWQPAANSLLRNKTLLAYPSQSTVYNITAERQPNCPIGKNSEVIIKICPQTVFIPNSFTPNNDGKNDVFKPSISQPLALYYFTIYNRYGQPVFETTDQQAGWDGKYKGTQQPQGGYMYQCRYRFNGGAEKNTKGYCMLIR